jgi:hypothetical protein
MASIKPGALQRKDVEQCSRKPNAPLGIGPIDELKLLEYRRRDNVGAGADDARLQHREHGVAKSQVAKTLPVSHGGKSRAQLDVRDADASTREQSVELGAAGAGPPPDLSTP